MARHRTRRRKGKRSRRSLRKFRGGAQQCLLVLLYCGLGNQLYQYAAGLVLSRKTGLDLCLVYPSEGEIRSKRDYRGLMIGTIAEVDRYEKAQDIIPKPDKYFDTFSNVNIQEIKEKKGDMRMPKEFYQNFTPLLPVLADIKKTIIEKEFNKPQYRQGIIGLDDSCAFLHVRRGDYLEHGWVHDDQYFVNALSRLNECANIQRIYVLSDDIAWCKEKLPAWKGVVSKSIECKDIPDELEAFWFMMNCKGGAIISTSTFSAWAAMLGANENSASCIIYPKQNPVFDKIVGGVPPNGGNVYYYPERWIML